MDDTTRRSDGSVPQWQALRAGAPSVSHTERLVREAWRHYYVARLAEVQFGAGSLEASLAHSNAITSYRELRGSLRELDPYYRAPSPAGRVSAAPPPVVRHLKLVRDEYVEPDPEL